MTLLAVAIVGVATVVTSSLTLVTVNRETALAMEAARTYVEEMQSSMDFEQIYAAFNATSADDPTGVTCPGSSFSVVGLSRHYAGTGPGAPAVGEVIFPDVNNQLREDTSSPSLGMPRDLNGDATIDALDHSADYQLLPVTIRLRWFGAAGTKTVDFRTLITRR